MGLLVAAMVVASLGGGAPSAAAAVPLPRPRPVLPAMPTQAVASPLGPPTACDQRLMQLAVFEARPNLSGPGACGGRDLVELSAVLLADGSRVAVEPKAMLRCDMAESFAAWLRDAVVPKLASLKSPLRAVENADSYECRSRNRVAGAKVSEHGKGGAIDVRGFVLADDRRVLLTDTAEPVAMREDLRQGACARFTTVLGPGSDGYHEQHIHLDGIVRHNGYRICEWAVLAPPQPARLAAGQIVPLPRPRPPVPDTRKL